MSSFERHPELEQEDALLLGKELGIRLLESQPAVEDVAHGDVDVSVEHLVRLEHGMIMVPIVARGGRRVVACRCRWIFGGGSGGFRCVAPICRSICNWLSLWPQLHLHSHSRRCTITLS